MTSLCLVTFVASEFCGFLRCQGSRGLGEAVTTLGIVAVHGATVWVSLATYPRPTCAVEGRREKAPLVLEAAQ